MVKLKAATIMESLVAMVLIIVCLGIGTMVFVNVLNNDKSRLQLKAILILKEESRKIKEESLFIDQEEKEGSWTIIRAFERYNGSGNLLQMKLQAIDENGKMIAEQNELVIPGDKK